MSETLTGRSERSGKPSSADSSLNVPNRTVRLRTFVASTVQLSSELPLIIDIEKVSPNPSTI